MDAEKDTKVRLTPEMAAMLDELIPLVEQVPELRAKLEYGGQVTRSGLLRELIARGAASIRHDLRGRVQVEPAPKPTPTKPAPKARKAAKRKKARK